MNPMGEFESDLSIERRFGMKIISSRKIKEKSRGEIERYLGIRSGLY